MNHKEVLDFIIEYKRANDGLSPSMREIMAKGVSSTSVVAWHLKKLELAGKISCNGVRGIKVKGGSWNMNRHIRILNIGIAIVVIAVVAFSFFGSMYFFVQTRRMEQTATQTYELRGELYICEFYQGDMQECWLVSDPDVGFGRSE